VALRFFNGCQYEATLTTIEETEGRIRDEGLLKRLIRLKTASEAYSAWDRFDHDTAFEALRQLEGPEFDENNRFLGTLNRMGEGKDRGGDVDPYPHYIADLYNNAVRRGDVEKKYDDAVARLYRVIELLGQYRLRKKFGIETSRVSIEHLPDTLKTEWLPRFKTGEIKAGLFDSYRLLAELGDDLGNLLESERMRDRLSNKNSSILAHGLEPVGEDTYRGMKAEVHRAISEHVPNLDDLLKNSTFPKLERL